MQTVRQHPAFQVRDARADDAPALARIYAAAVESGCWTLDTEAPPPRVFRDRLREPLQREAILVGSDPRGVVAWGQIRPYGERPGCADACESATYVTRSATGRGVGSLLLPVLLERAHALGYHHVVAQIPDANDAGLDLHQRFGFETVERVAARNGRAGEHHLLILRCPLSAPAPA